MWQADVIKVRLNSFVCNVFVLYRDERDILAEDTANVEIRPARNSRITTCPAI